MVLEDDFSERPESLEELDTNPVEDSRSDTIELSDVFSDAFVDANTEFASFDELVAASPADADSAATLGVVPNGSWDEFVDDHTVFADEEEFTAEARDHWVAEQLEIE